MKPNGYDCSFCEMWDDINGCWANKKNILTCEAYCSYVNNDDSVEDELKFEENYND